MYEIAIKMLNKLSDNGFEAYIVGGYPRDLILNRESFDIDICTNATPKQLKDIFKDSMLPKVEYGSVTVIYHKIRFEITTFRKDLKYENNRAPVKIKYIGKLVDDLKRRDFTINTLCIDKNGNIIDLLDGKKEIESKTIKMVGNPKHKLKEDSLRILRAIRFATILDFELDKDLKKYIKKYGYLLKKLSYYRKKEELEKIFLSPNALKGINSIKELELDKHLELSNLDNLVLTSSIIGIWAQLNVENIYTFSNNEREHIKQIKELVDDNMLDNYNLYKYGLYISSIVSEIKGIDKKIVNQRYNELPIKNRKEIDISANEICEVLNKKPGPFLKEVINKLEYEIVNESIKNEKEILKNYIKLLY